MHEGAPKFETTLLFDYIWWRASADPTFVVRRCYPSSGAELVCNAGNHVSPCMDLVSAHSVGFSVFKVAALFRITAQRCSVPELIH